MLRFQQSQQGVPKEKWVLAIVEPEAHFVKVGLQMLCANTMPRSDDAALEQRKGGVDSVRVNVAVHVFPIAMAYGFMLRE